VGAAADSASPLFLERPDPGFAERSFLAPRGAVHLADASGAAALDRLIADFADSDVELRLLERTELVRMLPVLREEWHCGAIEPSCADIDVAALHAAYLRRARRHGVELVTGACVTGIERRDGRWVLDTREGGFAADTLVNAAGAWADQVAGLAGVRPLGLQPYRRTMVQIAVDPPAVADLPLVIDVREHFYFKPEPGGRLWLSPHDETACAPCDTAPEEVDVALAIGRLERATSWRVQKIERKWAGLRTFAPDRRPVYGFAEDVADFFWCAGQGGFGIQTAPAAAKLAAALLLRHEPEAAVGPHRSRPLRARPALPEREAGSICGRSPRRRRRGGRRVHFPGGRHGPYHFHSMRAARRLRSARATDPLLDRLLVRVRQPFALPAATHLVIPSRR
jgi:D-arginine dehydrogenase